MNNLSPLTAWQIPVASRLFIRVCLQVEVVAAEQHFRGDASEGGKITLAEAFGFRPRDLSHPIQYVPTILCPIGVVMLVQV